MQPLGAWIPHFVLPLALFSMLQSEIYVFGIAAAIVDILFILENYFYIIQSS